MGASGIEEFEKDYELSFTTVRKNNFCLKYKLEKIWL